MKTFDIYAYFRLNWKFMVCFWGRRRRLFWGGLVFWFGCFCGFLFVFWELGSSLGLEVVFFLILEFKMDLFCCIVFFNLGFWVFLIDIFLGKFWGLCLGKGSVFICLMWIFFGFDFEKKRRVLYRKRDFKRNRFMFVSRKVAVIT